MPKMVTGSWACQDINRGLHRKRDYLFPYPGETATGGNWSPRMNEWAQTWVARLGRGSRYSNRGCPISVLMGLNLPCPKEVYCWPAHLEHRPVSCSVLRPNTDWCWLNISTSYSCSAANVLYGTFATLSASSMHILLATEPSGISVRKLYLLYWILQM